MVVVGAVLEVEGAVTTASVARRASADEILHVIGAQQFIRELRDWSQPLPVLVFRSISALKS